MSDTTGQSAPDHEGTWDARRYVAADGTIYTIVDDYGPVYVVLCESPDGKQHYGVMIPDSQWGKHPLMGQQPFGDVFPASLVFGIPTMHTCWTYCHRDYSRWKHFLGFSLYHEKRPEHARAIANSAARKHVTQLDAAKISAVIQ